MDVRWGLVLILLCFCRFFIKNSAVGSNSTLIFCNFCNYFLFAFCFFVFFVLCFVFQKKKMALTERYPFVPHNGKKLYSIKENSFLLPGKYIVTNRLGQGKFWTQHISCLSSFLSLWQLFNNTFFLLLGSYGMVVQAFDTETQVTNL